MYICHSETEKTNRNSHRKIIIFSLGFRQGKWHFKERKRNGQKQKGKSQMKPKVKFQVQGRLSKSCLLISNETRKTKDNGIFDNNCYLYIKYGTLIHKMTDSN